VHVEPKGFVFNAMFVY